MLKYCPVCDSEVEEVDSGVYKGFKWNQVVCTECGITSSDEPDWDSEPGGHDDY